MFVLLRSFTDKEGGTFDDVYLSEEFQAKTKEIQQKGQAAMEEAINDGYYGVKWCKMS